MVDIAVKGVWKAFEQDKYILKGVDLEVYEGERVGLLGRNGAGKSTLFRIITGEIESDRGDVVLGSGRRVGIMTQIPRFPEHFTTEDVLKTAQARLTEMQQRLTAMQQAMAEGKPVDERAYDRLQSAFEGMGGYETEVRRNKVAGGLDIPPEMRARPFNLLSGGEKTRVNLARLILEETDILLLDEPTNHLDLNATEWLEDYLLHFRGTVLTISHDRYFLDRAVQRIVELVDGKAVLYPGNYSFFVEEKQRRYEEAMKTWEKNQKQIAQLQKAADDLHLWAFMGNDKLHKRAFSMEKRIERLKQAEKPTAEKRLKARFGEREFRGDDALVIHDLSKSFGGRTLFDGVELQVTGGELSRLRLCILMKEDVNFLILDEPTNHLDILSREWMEDALTDYSEALLFVSHDRYFISRFATRIWELEDGVITDWRCPFEEYRARKERLRQAALARQAEEKKQLRKEQPKREKPAGGQKALQKKLAATEREIAALEERLKELETAIEENATDYEALGRLFEEKTAAEAEIEAKYEDWGVLSEELEGLS